MSRSPYFQVTTYIESEEVLPEVLRTINSTCTVASPTSVSCNLLATILILQREHLIQNLLPLFIRRRNISPDTSRACRVPARVQQRARSERQFQCVQSDGQLGKVSHFVPTMFICLFAREYGNTCTTSLESTAKQADFCIFEQRMRAMMSRYVARIYLRSYKLV